MQLHTTLRGKIDEAMTPLTAAATAIVEPTFANGMGSLQEDAARGLRCPLQGCGGWYHILSRHLNHRHRAIGGAARVRELLSLPATATLMSHASLGRRRERHPEGRTTPPTPAQAAKGGAKRAETSQTMGYRNLRSRCDAQLRQRLDELAQRLGRTPTFEEASVAWGSGDMSYIVRLYGSWNAFKKACGVPTLPRGGQEKYTVDDVLARLRIWSREHEDELPSYDEAAGGGVRIYPQTVLRVFSTREWKTAMARAALILSLGTSRYYPVERRRRLLRRCSTCLQLTKTADACEWCGAAIESAA